MKNTKYPHVVMFHSLGHYDHWFSVVTYEELETLKPFNDQVAELRDQLQEDNPILALYNKIQKETESGERVPPSVVSFIEYS